MDISIFVIMLDLYRRGNDGQFKTYLHYAFLTILLTVLILQWPLSIYSLERLFDQTKVQKIEK